MKPLSNQPGRPSTAGAAGQPPLYTLSGPIVHGLGNGRKVRMPTANLALDPGQALPPFGVYAAIVTIGGKAYMGVTNVGLRPTLEGEQAPTVETFILDFAGSLYGRKITLSLYHFLRPTRRMASLDDVHDQVEKDSRRARQLLSPLVN